MATKAITVSVFVLISFLWGSFTPITKHVLSRYDPFVFSLFESAVLLPIALAGLALWRKRVTQRIVLRGVVSGILLAAALLTGTLSVNYTTATNSALLGSLDALIAMLIAQLFWKKSCSLFSFGVVTVSCVGAYLVIGQSDLSGGSLLGDSLAIVACFLYVVFLYLAQYDAVVDDDAADVWPKIAVEFSVVATCMMCVSYLLADWSHYSPSWPSDAVIFVYVGVMTSLVPLILCIIFVRHLSVVTAACLLMLEPVWATMLSMVFLGELLTILAYVGGFMIILAALARVFDDFWHTKPTDPITRYRRPAPERRWRPRLAFSKSAR